MRPRPPLLPRISHLQFLALGILQGGERAGREIRLVAVRFGVKRSAAAFYQMMARLERDQLVEGWYHQIRVGDQAVTERRYRITPAGTKAWARTREFYDHVVGATREEWSRA